MPFPETGLQLNADQLAHLKANNFTHVKASYGDEVKIEEHEVLVITGNPEFVTTQGLGPCLGMILVSKQPQVILGLHYPDPVVNDPEIVGKFLDLIDLLKINVSKAEIAVAGVSPNRDRSIKQAEDFQKALLVAVEAKGFPRREIKHDWADIDSGCTINYEGDRRKLSINKSDDYED